MHLDEAVDLDLAGVMAMQDLDTAHRQAQAWAKPSHAEGRCNRYSLRDERCSLSARFAMHVTANRLPPAMPTRRLSSASNSALSRTSG
ncbi:hypothetical protein AO069_27170 [Pseudomonas syringae pv. syringae PD2774]|nr:hypothetical protein AO069_27170 [Pseudomonas syringae pv. syringae PD2774]